MSVCSFLGKYILYLFNLLCLLSGVSIIAIAIVITEKFYKWSNFIDAELLTAPQVLMAIGLGVLVIAIIGMCGVLRDNGCCLTLFSVLLSIVLIGELVLAGVTYYVRGDIENYAKDHMNSTMTRYNATDEATTITWDILQADLKCCGISGPDDWKQFTHNDTLPKSCCHFIPLDGCTVKDSYQVGCFVELEHSLQENSQFIIWSAVGFALVQFLAVILACCRKCSVREEYETV